MQGTRGSGEQRHVRNRSLTVKCQLCKQHGHNKRRCLYNPNKGKKVETKKRKSDVDAATANATNTQPSQLSLLVLNKA